ncbi:MAG: hypothetical protein AAGF04_04315 [Chlamydiota bacterium]
MKKKSWKFFRETPKKGWAVRKKEPSPTLEKKRELKEILETTLKKNIPT